MKPLIIAFFSLLFSNLLLGQYLGKMNFDGSVLDYCEEAEDIEECFVDFIESNNVIVEGSVTGSKLVFSKDSSAWFIETTFLLHKVFKGIDEEHYYSPIKTYTRTRKPDDYSESGEALYTLPEGGFIPGTLSDGEVCIIFGDQRREDGFTGLHDIFTIRYNLSNEWNFVIGQDSLAIVQARNKALFFKTSEDVYDFLTRTDNCKLVDITGTLFRRARKTYIKEK